MLPGFLPIDSLIPEISALVLPGKNLVIEAAPGAGKTTRVPPALFRDNGEVIVLEPRRIAARMAARRVGPLAGYQVRFEDATTKDTRIRFVTEGILNRRLITDPTLRGVATVILDEFHERHLETDLALALLRRLQKTARPDLSIVVMSATLDTGPVAAFLGGCPVVRSEGRLFELRVEHTPYSPAPLEKQVSAAVERLIREEPEGDILVFLPGAAEIRRAAGELARFRELLIVPLYGDLPPAEQDRAIAPASQRKVVLATNIAESSLTIEGVRAVVDSGLARIPVDSPWTGLPSLEVKRISKASAIQRAGRAGRTGPGRVIRLYTAEDFHRRADHDVPELLRRELSGLCLQLRAMKAGDVEWLDAPPAEALEAANALLDRLDADGAMARIPVHPRLARLILSGASDEACQMAAMLSNGQKEDERVYRQLRRYVPAGPGEDLDCALLRAFPDRVGRRGSGGKVLLSTGNSVDMKKPPAEFMIVIDPPWFAHPIEPELLLEHARDVLRVEWNRQTERVESVTALMYDELTIEESRSAPPDELAAAMLAEKAIEAGLLNTPELEELRARAEFAGVPVDDARLLASVKNLCCGLRSLSDARRALEALPAQIEPAELERIAPSRLKLKNGRSVKVRYERGKPPWVASRLQDFFGMRETPRVKNGQVALTVHLLAPNQRPVQTTTDLAGFWERLYPQLRRELGRRYPRHAWPEDPLSM